MSGNTKTRETRLFGPVVDRKARGDIPKKKKYAIPKIVMIKSRNLVNKYYNLLVKWILVSKMFVFG